MITKRKFLVCEKIGKFFLRECEGDYEKTEQKILSMGISDVEVLDSTTLVIRLSRPGILIGRRGETIDRLTNFLGMNLKIMETNNINNMIIPTEPSPYDDDFLGR